ncbi:MAG: aminotransferase class III-fold pyridoxal phosphate-dependent enzyme, partial [Syntrophobacteraceae bacterium]
NNTAGNLAAIIVETAQGTAGNIFPPPEFLHGLVEIAHERGALLIADEMITGFGRTGKMFGSNQTGIRPDIMTIGKGMGSGFPVSGLVSTDEFTASMPFSKPSSSSSSYGGNPLASTAALATIQTIIDERLVDNSREMGEYLLRGLRALEDKYDFIGNVGGCGLMIGVELVKDRKTKEPLDRAVTRRMFLETLKRGLVCMNYKANFRINPPLVLTREEADEGLSILDEVFAHVVKHIPYK